MKILHWSSIYLSYATIEITYSDNARQGWDYDCSKFAAIEDMKANLTADFTDTSGFAADPHIVRTDWADVSLIVTLNGETHTIDLGVPIFTTGAAFADLIFVNIGEALAWQPVAIS
jgi:hypothetical protein